MIQILSKFFILKTTAKYLIIDLKNENYIQLTEDDKIEVVAKRVLVKYLEAFKELAK